MGNIEEVLLNYRIHEEQVSNVYGETQLKLTHEISKEYRDKLLANGEIDFEIDLNSISYLDMKKQLNIIKNDSKKKSISKDVVLNIAHYILQHTSKPSLFLYIAYFIEMKSYMYNYKLEIKIFIQSLLMLNRDAKLYQFLKRFA